MEALNSIINNSTVLLELWDESLDVVKDSDMKARVQGVTAQLRKFEFFFGVTLRFLILRHIDNLNKSLQSRYVSQEVMSLTLATLKSLRNDSSVDVFLEANMSCFR